MKIWAAIRTDNKIQQDTVMDFDGLSKARVEDWNPIIGELCHELDLARPVLLKKHLNDLTHFSHTTFTAADFMEPISFDKLTIEIFPEKKNK
ncbi:hypothetical protein MR810_07370 [bacterium]|nr:hypothetical protein [bacterium]MDD5917963.1 hypothetical protein [bacterium]